MPLWLKIAFTLFICVQVWFYWKNYGPSNFLYFCDFALFLTLAALWTEHALLASIPAVGILAPQSLWVADFVAAALGHPITGMTNYMFDGEHNSVESRAISLFHGWLPFLLAWLVYRLGYDRRALLAWTALAWALCLICYNFFPAPGEVSDPNIPVNGVAGAGLHDRLRKDARRRKVFTSSAESGAWPCRRASRPPRPAIR